MTAVHGEPRPANLGQGWTVDDSTFGARLALIRQRMQWNVKEAARECGIPAASWGTWENGAMPRRYTEMCKLIAYRTGCDLTWLTIGPRPGFDEDSRPNVRSTEPSPRRTTGRRTDEPRRARLVFGDSTERPTHGPISRGPSGSTRPGSSVALLTRRPAAGRPANRPKAA